MTLRRTNSPKSSKPLARNRKEQKKIDYSYIDEKDIKIISSLMSGYDSQRISSEFQIPLSTVQRRTRLIIQSGLLQHYFKPDYRRLGLKKGMIHVYLRDGDMKSTAGKVSGMEGITSVSIHIGNSDIVADFVYRDSEQIVDIVSSIKKIEGVDRTVWSEEVYAFPMNPQSMSVPFQKLMGGI